MFSYIRAVFRRIFKRPSKAELVQWDLVPYSFNIDWFQEKREGVSFSALSAD